MSKSAPLMVHTFFILLQFCVFTGNSYLFSRIIQRTQSNVILSSKASSNDLLDRPGDVKIDNIINQNSITNVTTSSLPSLPINDELVGVSELFISAWRNAINGNQIEMTELLQPGAKWDNPFVSTVGEYLDGLKTFASFFGDPSLVVYNVRKINNLKVELEFQLSFWYPMYWRPRIIIPGKVEVELSSQSSTTTKNGGKSFQRVSEKWDLSVFELLTQQFFPRFWDMFHLFHTPTPEFPPCKSLGKIGSVEFVEIFPTVSLEVRWSGLANVPGPPLQVIPDFALIGPLETSRIGREVFYTVLPPEVQSGTYECPETGRTRKQSSWFFHIPTCLQEKVVQNFIKTNVNGQYTKVDLSKNDKESSDVEDLNTPDMDEDRIVVGYDSPYVMRSLTKGTLRGDFEFNNTLVNELRNNEKVDYIYRLAPRRIIARTSFTGSTDMEKVSKAFQLLKSTVVNNPTVNNIIGRKGSIKLSSPPMSNTAAVSGKTVNPWLGLQLYNSKVCFNDKGQPGMTIYEIQFQTKLTKVYVELECNDSLST